MSSGLLIVFGVIALAANGVSLLLLRHGQAESLNLRGAFLEVASDTLGAAAVIVTGVIIATTGFTRADPIASLAVGAADPAPDLAAAAGRRSTCCSRPARGAST